MPSDATPLRPGGRALRHATPRGLSPSCVHRAKELLATRVDGDISIAEVARACGLSRTYFSRAFRLSTGTSPLRWMQQHKIERAKTLLAAGRHSIADVALACGFGDQSHLTRTFSHLVGVAPAAWRRQCIDARSIPASSDRPAAHPP